jgi:uncharacterized iron-regulated protein
MISFLCALTVQSVDAELLPMPNDRSVIVRKGEAVASETGKPATASDIAESAHAKRVSWVYVGETHDNADAHKWQADVIRELGKRYARVVVGMEMYQRAMQSTLDHFLHISEAEFVEKSQWKTQWGFDFALYKPVFDATREVKGALVALNVPRDWVRTASREGFEKLPPEALAELPEFYLGNADHRKIFDALVGGHAGGSVDGMYRGQVLWDEAMADSAIKWLAANPSSMTTVFVVVAGNGHLMYGQGINYRVKRRLGQGGVTLYTSEFAEGQQEKRVSAGLGDFIAGVPAPKRGSSRPAVIMPAP